MDVLGSNVNCGPAALQREMLAEEYQRLGVPMPWSEKIRDLLEGVARLVA